MKEKWEQYLINNIDEIVSILKNNLGIKYIPTFYLTDIVGDLPSEFNINISQILYKRLQNDILYKGIDYIHHDIIGIISSKFYKELEELDNYKCVDIVMSVFHEVRHFYQYCRDRETFLKNSYIEKFNKTGSHDDNVLEIDAENYSEDFLKYCVENKLLQISELMNNET